MNNQDNNLQQNPYQQPVQQNIYHGYQPPEPPKKNIKAVVIGVCLGIIVLVLIITLIVLVTKLSGNADNTKSEYFSQEYYIVYGDMAKIEQDYYEDNSLPEYNIPIVFEKQKSYLNAQKEKGIIKSYSVDEYKIHIEFKPDGNIYVTPFDYTPGVFIDNLSEDDSYTSNTTTTATTTEKVNILTPLEEKLNSSKWYLCYRHNSDTFEFDTEKKTVKYTSYASKYGEEEYSATYECVDENTIEFTIDAYEEKYIVTNYDDDSKVYVEIILEDGSNLDGHADYLSNDEDESVELFSDYYKSELY